MCVCVRACLFVFFVVVVALDRNQHKTIFPFSYDCSYCALDERKIYFFFLSVFITLERFCPE